jgi:hypothetical protein
MAKEPARLMGDNTTPVKGVVVYVHVLVVWLLQEVTFRGTTEAATFHTLGDCKAHVSDARLTAIPGEAYV